MPKTKRPTLAQRLAKAEASNRYLRRANKRLRAEIKRLKGPSARSEARKLLREWSTDRLREQIVDVLCVRQEPPIESGQTPPAGIGSPPA